MLTVTKRGRVATLIEKKKIVSRGKERHFIMIQQAKD